jgi:peptidoglycan/xylan/chitin deacetylase (PgdA/CDA1 family)
MLRGYFLSIFDPAEEEAMKHRFCLALLLGSFLCSHAFGGDDFPRVQVVPWDGHKAATSLTFDDSDPSHLDVAIPELNQRHLKATFFLIANRTDRKDEWRKILQAGHEIGNQTLDHKHAGELSPLEEEAQVVGARNVLQKEFGVPVETFAYPYTEITPGLKEWVGKNHLLARGGYGKTYVLTPLMEPDWMDIPSRGTQTKLPFAAYQGWIDESVKKGGWLVWRIHGLEGTPWGYEPISKKTFERILDAIGSRDIWVGTFLEVGAYFRAQKIFEGCRVLKSGPEETWSWNVPDHFPMNVHLKLHIQSGPRTGQGDIEIRQGSQKIVPDKTGTYPIDFAQKEVTLRLFANH